jgi:hypothetical protein
MSANIDSVTPTVATASDPSRETQKMSTTANSDSIDISRTIGTASMSTARPTGTFVKSSDDPRIASRMVAQNPGGGADGLGATSVSFTCMPMTGCDGFQWGLGDGDSRAQAAARSNKSLRSRAFRVRAAARSNSARASRKRPSFSKRSPRTVGKR